VPKLGGRIIHRTFTGNKFNVKAGDWIGMKRYKLVKIILLLLFFLPILNCGCTNKKVTKPIEPITYLMKDYFPLNIGDEWNWEREHIDSIPEPFVDMSDSSLGEPFTDVNQNGIYDFGEPFEDVNFNGKYDSPYDHWTPGIPYSDNNHNGEYDLPNGVWDSGEPFTDLDSNDTWNWIISPDTIRLKGEIIDTAYLDGSETFTRQSLFPDSSDGLITRDGFSNDSLGLRWHSHLDIIQQQWGVDELSINGTIITLAKPSFQLKDSVVNIDTAIYYFSHLVTWISVFDGLENVTCPAGTFSDCLKFRSESSGWESNMQRFSGVSLQWYAKNVGLVKSEGPGEGEYWILKSAKVGGKNYP
jgi:hypothetical protein